MNTYLSFSVIKFLSIELGQYGFHGHAFGYGLHVCKEARLAGERWAWVRSDMGTKTGRIGPFSFTTARRLPTSAGTGHL